MYGLAGNQSQWSKRSRQNKLTVRYCRLHREAGVEVGLAPRWTLDLSANYNGWTLSHDRKWKHWLLQPEARYWFCDRFAGHFIGIHALGGQYNAGGLKNNISFLGTDFSKLSDCRYQGWFIGSGIAYGYAWILGRHWNLEAEIGIGYVYTRYDAIRAPPVVKNRRRQGSSLLRPHKGLD